MLLTGGDGEGVDIGTEDSPRALTEDGDGVDAGTGDGSRALTWDEDGLASVQGGDGVGPTSGGLTGIDIEDGDGVDDVRLSRGGNSLTMYHLFFAVVIFPLQSCDGCRNLSFGERATRDSRVHLPRKENTWSRHQRLFEENVRKTKEGLRILKNKGSGVVYIWGMY